MHVSPFAPVKLCCELVCTVDLRCFEGRLSTVSAKGFAFSQPLRMFQTLRGLAEPPPPAPELRLTGDQSCISSLHAIKREGEGREAVSASQQTLLNSQQKQARVHTIRWFRPSGSCFRTMHFVFSQQRPHLHSDFETFSQLRVPFAPCRLC